MTLGKIKHEKTPHNLIETIFQDSFKTFKIMLNQDEMLIYCMWPQFLEICIILMKKVLMSVFSLASFKWCVGAAWNAVVRLNIIIIV